MVPKRFIYLFAVVAIFLIEFWIGRNIFGVIISSFEAFSVVAVLHESLLLRSELNSRHPPWVNVEFAYVVLHAWTNLELIVFYILMILYV